MKGIKKSRSYKFMMIVYAIMQMIAGGILLLVANAKIYGNYNPFEKQQFEVSVGLIVFGSFLLIYNIIFIKIYRTAKRKLYSKAQQKHKAF
jgi:hypothetical protein